MKKSLLMTILLLCGTILFSATTDESIQQAKTKYAADNSSEAITILDGVLKENPANAQAKKILADICVDTGEREYENRNFKNAYEYFKKAVKVLPTHPIATERYWKMKSDFDVTNLKNEGGSVPAKNVVVEKDNTAANKSVESFVEKKRIEKEKKKIKRIEANPRIADDIYSKKIIGMEERFNQRLLDMNAQLKKTTELEEDKGIPYKIADNPILMFTALILLFIFAAAFTLFIVFLSRLLKKRTKSKSGDKEYERLFADNSGQYYNELIKMQNIKELINKIKSGDLDWSMIKKSIGEMDRELRLEVFSYIEIKVDPTRQPITMAQADILMALILDGDEYLRRRVSSFLSGQIGAAEQTGQKALPYQHSRNGSRPDALEITDQASTAIDYSIMEDLNIILTLSKIVDRKVFNDKHAERVGVDTYDMARLLGLPQEECNLFYIAGLIHDVGYLDLPSEILNKKSTLTDEEFNIIKTHTKRGIALLDFAVLPKAVSDGILYHHEKFSGEGYPDGLAGKDIPLVARIISIFDMYEALIHPRPQRPAFPTKEAQRIIKKGSGKIFDPELVKVFEQMVKENLHISFIGSREGVGNSFVSLNFAIEMVSRNYHVTYSNCIDDSENKHFFKSLSPAEGKDSVNIQKTKIEKLDIMSFSKRFDSRYSAKVEQLIHAMEGKSNIFIHNIREPLANPYNTILQNSDVWVITLRIEATAISDYFNIVKKMLMLEKHPSNIFLIFNYTRDIERAIETYQKILKDTDELSIDIRPFFLGVVRNDILRQAHAIKLGKPIREAFSECSVSSSFSFMADKILKKKSNINSDQESMLLIEEGSD